MRNYLTKMETYSYILSSSEHNIYEDQILAILAGFGPEYDFVVAMITSREDPCSLKDVSSLLLAQEHMIKQNSTSFTET